MRGLDVYITGNYGENQFMEECCVCGEIKHIDELCDKCEEYVCVDCMPEHLDEHQEEDLEEEIEAQRRTETEGEQKDEE